MKKFFLFSMLFFAAISLLNAQSITTTFAGGNGHDGNMIDFAATGANDVTIDSLNFNIDAIVGTAVDVLVFYKVGTYVGSETNAAAWTRHDSVHVISAGSGNPTKVHIGGLVIPAGQTYGLYLTTTSGAPYVAYTNGTNVYSDANVTITAGVGKAYPFSSTIAGRIWNGTIYYSLNDCTTPMFDPTTPTYCQGDAASISLNASSGFYNWYSDAGKDTLINTTNPYAFTAQNTTTYYVDALCPTIDTTMMSVGAQATTYSPQSRGYYFTAPSDFVITGLRVPTDNTGDQTIEVIRFTNGPPTTSVTPTNDFVSLGYWQGVAGTGIIPANIIVHAGDIMGIVGVRGSTTSYVSAPYSTSIDGNSVTLNRLGMQYDLSTQQLHDVWTGNSSIGRVEMYYRGGYASTVTNVDVTVVQPDFVQITDVICDNDSILVNGVWQNTTGVYYDTLTNTSFCDSVVELDLSVNPTNFETQPQEICQGDSLFAEGAWQIATGLYYDTLSNVNFCDSVIETDLTVHLNPVVNLGLDSTICDGESILLNPGVYTSYLWSQGDTSQTLLVDTTNFIIGTNQISIIVTDSNTCVASDTIVITIDDCAAIKENTNLNLAQIYPNPVKDRLFVEFNELGQDKMMLSIISIEGKLISIQEITELRTTIDFSYLSKGIYLLKFTSNQQTEVYKVIHE